MTDVWTCAQVATALGAPPEAFFAFAHFLGVRRDDKVDIVRATRLAIEWHVAGNGTAGAIGDAVTGLTNAMCTALGAPPG